MSAVALVSTISVRRMEKTSTVSAKSISTTLGIYSVLRMFVKGGWKRMTIDEAIKHAIEVAESHNRIKQIKAVTLEECKCADDKWIPISESIPPFGQDVLVCDLDGDMYITYLHLNGTWGFEYCGNKIKNVVAWQELPLPWKAESEE